MLESTSVPPLKPKVHAIATVCILGPVRVCSDYSAFSGTCLCCSCSGTRDHFISIDTHPAILRVKRGFWPHRSARRSDSRWCSGPALVGIHHGSIQLAHHLLKGLPAPASVLLPVGIVGSPNHWMIWPFLPRASPTHQGPCRCPREALLDPPPKNQS